MKEILLNAENVKKDYTQVPKMDHVEIAMSMMIKSFAKTAKREKTNRAQIAMNAKKVMCSSMEFVKLAKSIDVLIVQKTWRNAIPVLKVKSLIHL